MHSLVKIKLQQDFGPDKFIPDKELMALMKVLPNIKVGYSLHAASESRRDQEHGDGAGLDRELDFFCFSCFPTAELWTLPL